MLTRAARIVVLAFAGLVAAWGCDPPTAADLADADVSDAEIANGASDTDDAPHAALTVREEDFQIFHQPDVVGPVGAEPEVVVLEDGDFLPVVEGYQVANMVVVGLRTSAAFAEPLTVHVRLEASGQLHGETTWAFQRFRSADAEGWRSVYDLFLVLDGCDLFDEGTPGAIVVTVTDDHGNVYSHRTNVALGRNDLCQG